MPDLGIDFNKQRMSTKSKHIKGDITAPGENDEDFLDTFETPIEKKQSNHKVTQATEAHDDYFNNVGPAKTTTLTF